MQIQRHAISKVVQQSDGNGKFSAKTLNGQPSETSESANGMGVCRRCWVSNTGKSKSATLDGELKSVVRIRHVIAAYRW